MKHEYEKRKQEELMNELINDKKYSKWYEKTLPTYNEYDDNGYIIEIPYSKDDMGSLIKYINESNDETFKNKRDDIENKINHYNNVISNRNQRQHELGKLTKQINMNEMLGDYEFKNDVLKDEYDNIYDFPLDIEDLRKANALIDYDKLIDKENKIISASPYSFSLYGINDGEKIDWDSKPKDSYRLSNHWNFESRNKKHGKLKENKDYNNDIIIGKYDNNKNNYKTIENYNNRNYWSDEL